jgi:protein required for attachment to host cells
MSERLRIPAGAWILVGDGRKALVLRNHGDDLCPSLQVQRVFSAPPNPATHAQGTDRPPRAIFGGQRSAIEQTDWHELAEHHFADEVAAAVGKAHRKTPIEALIIVAPPRTLAELRRAFSDELKHVILAEVHKDLTKHPIVEIERHLAGP